MILALALSLAPAAHAQDAVTRYALLVGHNDGGAGRTVLRYAHDDAEEMAGVLVELGGISPEHENVLLDPDLATLQRAIEDIRTRLEAANGDAEFLFYYSGHSDEEALLLGEERYGYRELRAMLDGLPARVRLAILDSCSSGALILAKGGSRTAPFLVDQSTRVDGFAYMTSSSADEVAQEAERIGGSYFTHYLASGLRGAADISGDGRVTLNEAYSFANQETLLRTERTQHGPQHASHETHLSGTGDLVLTDLGMTSASLVLDESLDGRTMVRDENGNLVVELQKLPGRAIELGLAEGRYTVTLLRGDEQYGDTTVDLVLGSSMPVSADELVWHRGELTVARGGPPILPEASVTARELDVERWPRFLLWPGFVRPSEYGDTFVASMSVGNAVKLDGFGLGLVGFHVNERVDGFETALGWTRAGDLDGVQLSVGANLLKQGGEGLQVSVGFNAAGGAFDGGQVSVGFNAADNVKGAQITTGANFAPHGIRGFQGAAGLNVARGESTGLQLASVNIAKAFDGAQISLVNIGGDIDGLQLGLVNIAHDVKGAQIGIVNIANDVKGAPIGLLSVEKEGRHDVLVFASESDVGNVEAKLGGDYLHTILGGGVSPDQGYLSVGLGAHLPFGKVVWSDLDVLGAAYVGLGTTSVGRGGAQGSLSGPPTPVIRPRVTVGFQVAEQFAPFVGATLNIRVPTDDTLVDVAPSFIADGQSVMMWPGFFGGVQF